MTGINESLFFPKVGDFYSEAASKIVGEDVYFTLARLSEEDAIGLQEKLANLPEDEATVTHQLGLARELFQKLIIGWSGFNVEFTDDNLTACISEMPIDVKLEIMMAGINYARTGILEDKRSKNVESSPN